MVQTEAIEGCIFGNSRELGSGESPKEAEALPLWGPSWPPLPPPQLPFDKPLSASMVPRWRHQAPSGRFRRLGGRGRSASSFWVSAGLQPGLSSQRHGQGQAQSRQKGSLGVGGGEC